MRDVHTKRTAKRSQSVINQTRARDLDICQCCGCGDGTEVHHIEPLSLGGKDEPNNCISLCPDCHSNVPVNPNHFLGYQQQGGAAWLLMTSLWKLSGRSITHIENLNYQQKTELINSFRNRWGWQSGSDLPMRDYLNGETTRAEAIRILYQRVSHSHSLMNKISKALRIAPECKDIKNTIEPNLKDFLTKEPEELQSLFGERIDILENICTNLKAQTMEYINALVDSATKLGSFPELDLNDLTAQLSLALEDINELIDEIPEASLTAACARGI